MDGCTTNIVLVVVNTGTNYHGSNTSPGPCGGSGDLPASERLGLVSFLLLVESMTCLRAQVDLRVIGSAGVSGVGFAADCRKSSGSTGDGAGRRDSGEITRIGMRGDRRSPHPWRA